MPLQTMARGIVVVSLIVLAGCAGYYKDNDQRTVGQATDDAAIQAVIKTRMVSDRWIDGLQINTSVSQGVVTLEGMVDSREEYRRVLEIAKSTQGVVKVVDKLMMNPYASD